MSSTTRTPTNPNFLHPNKFQVVFSRAPELAYFCQSVTIPGFNIGEGQFSTPFIDLFVPGDKMTFDLLTFTFLIDEHLAGWLTIANWMKGLTFPEKFEQYGSMDLQNKTTAKSPTPQYADAIVTLLSSSHTPLYRFTYVNCFPTSLGPLMLSSTDTPDSVLTSDVSLRFQDVSITKLF